MDQQDQQGVGCMGSVGYAPSVGRVGNIEWKPRTVVFSVASEQPVLMQGEGRE
jgi:hypothetical protein